ncbi:MAG: hypothetical protein ACM3ML_15740 [Micromonosporaceae bacterium]
MRPVALDEIVPLALDDESLATGQDLSAFGERELPVPPPHDLVVLITWS